MIYLPLNIKCKYLKYHKKKTLVEHGLHVFHCIFRYQNGALCVDNKEYMYQKHIVHVTYRGLQ